MSSNNNQTSLKKDNDTFEFPVAAIVSLSVGGYVILVISFLIIRRMLVSKGSCQTIYCCPENGTCFSICGKINEACPSCCCCSSTEGCLATLCCTQKEINCGDIFCSSCMCTEGCSHACSEIQYGRLHLCSCHPGRCCTGKPLCPSCFDKNIDPNACGCLCLEIKLRPTHCGSIPRNQSAPPRINQNQHFTSHEPADNVATANHENTYQASNILDTANKNFGTYQIEGDNIQRQQQSSSMSPTKTASDYHQISSNGPITSELQGGHSHPNDESNTHVNFQRDFHDRNGNPFQLPCSTLFSSNLSGDSSKDFSAKSLLNKATNTDSDMKTSGRSTSRIRRSIQPGQKSQRFPNKILVSCETLNYSIKSTKTAASEISFISSSDKSLSNLSAHSNAFNFHRPLPPLKITLKPLT